MVNRIESHLKGYEIEVGRWDVYEAEVSTDDTITLEDYSSTQNLDQHIVIKKSDRSTVANTVAYNVITITQQGLTNVKILIFAAGIGA